MQVASGHIGLGGFCHGVVRAEVDLIHNQYRFAAAANGDGWEDGIVPEGSQTVFAC